MSLPCARSLCQIVYIKTLLSATLQKGGKIQSSNEISPSGPKVRCWNGRWVYSRPGFHFFRDEGTFTIVLKLLVCFLFRIGSRVHPSSSLPWKCPSVVPIYAYPRRRKQRGRRAQQRRREKFHWRWGKWRNTFGWIRFGRKRRNHPGNESWRQNKTDANTQRIPLELNVLGWLKIRNEFIEIYRLFLLF